MKAHQMSKLILCSLVLCWLCLVSGCATSQGTSLMDSWNTGYGLGNMFGNMLGGGQSAGEK